MAASSSGLPLELRDVRATVADRGEIPRTLLDIPAFRIDAGERIAICGPSGSGKTTLLNLLAAIERPGAGAVRWGAVTVSALGEAVADRWRRETLGLVFQAFHLFPGLSALENVLLPLRFDRWRVPGDLRAAGTALLERVGVRPRARTDALSRGELQRVALARALLRRPAIVLADEPTASLDRANAIAVVDLLLALCAESGATLVVATHDAELSAPIGRSVEIVDGDLRARAAATRLRLTPAA
jgi:putative ABC transport system ATP-binding protein